MTEPTHAIEVIPDRTSITDLSPAAKEHHHHFFRQLAAYLQRLDGALEIALEPTADYHRNLAYFLKTRGFEVKLVSSIGLVVRGIQVSKINGWGPDFHTESNNLKNF